MLRIGTKAPEFSLPDQNGVNRSLADYLGKKVILYGDYSYYWLADRAGRTLQRLNELYAMTDQVGFKLTERLDGRLILPEAVKVLKMKTA